MNESNIQQNTGKANDEIDILDVGSRVWGGFKSFLKDLIAFLLGFIIGVKDLIVFAIVFFIRKSVWIVSFALLGIIWGMVYYYIQKPFYTSRLEGFSGGVDNTVVIDHINKLYRMINPEKPETLAENLGLTVEQAKAVRNIKAHYGIDVNFDGKPDYVDEKGSYDPRNRRDTIQVRVPSLFYVRVDLYDESVLPYLRESLFKFINSNTYIQTLYEIDKKQKRDLIDELAKEINKIDTVHLISVNNNKKASLELGQKLFLMGSEPEIRLFYPEILSLYGQIQDLQRSLEISDKPVIVIQDFVAAQYVERGSTYYIFRLGFTMALMGLTCAIFWQYRKTLWAKIISKEVPTPKFLTYIQWDERLNTVKREK